MFDQIFNGIFHGEILCLSVGGFNPSEKYESQLGCLSIFYPSGEGFLLALPAVFISRPGLSEPQELR